MGLGRLVLTAVGAFVAGAIGVVSAVFVLSSTVRFQENTGAWLLIILIAFFAPAVGVTRLLGGRLSLPKTIASPSPPLPAPNAPEAHDALRAELAREGADKWSGHVAAVL